MLPKINSYNDTPDADLDVLAEFISHPRNNYGSGMDNLSIAYINRELAIQGHCSFIDPYYVNGDIGKLRTQLVGQNNRKYLVTAPIQVYANNNSPNEDLDNLFKNTLEMIRNFDYKFDKIFIPIGCQQNNMAGHNVALILEKNDEEYRTTLLDQLGLYSYRDTKSKILEQLESIGYYDIDMNREPLTDRNRMDCASVTSLLRDYTLNGTDMRDVKDLFDEDTSVKFSEKAIDDQHEKDKDIAIDCCIRLADEILEKNVVVERGNKVLTKSDEVVLDYINKHRRNNNCNSYNTTTIYRGR